LVDVIRTNRDRAVLKDFKMSAATVENDMKLDLNGWVDLLVDIKFPILDVTAKSVVAMNSSTGMSVDRFCDSMLHDPGTVLTMLRWANSLPRGRLSSEVTTLESATMMIGLDKIKHLPREMTALKLPAEDEHMRAYIHVACRAFHAGYQAYDWASRRADMVPKESFVAGFMHNIGAMAILLNGGDEINKIRDVMENDDMSADEAQYLILGFSLKQLSHALAVRWKLPELVVESLMADKASNPRVYGVMLACQLARVAESGWYSLEMMDCMQSISEYLELGLDRTTWIAHQNAIDAARESEWYQVIPAAALLPRIPEFDLDCEGNPIIPEDEHELQHFCLMPQTQVYNDIIENIRSAASLIDIGALMTLSMRAMHDGLGLNRVVFAMLEGVEHDELKARYMMGTDNDPEFNQFGISLIPVNLFTHVMKKAQSIWLNDGNKEKYLKLVPNKLKDIIRTDSFFAGSVFVDGKPIGMFYADRHTKDCHLDEMTYKRFKVLIQLVGKAIEAQRAAKK